MRTPTPQDEALTWWRDTLAGRDPPTHDEPQCGFFKRRYGTGPWLPARIWLDSPADPATGELLGDEKKLCEIDGKLFDALDQWLWLAKHPVGTAEYKFLAADRAWAREHLTGPSGQFI